jgi:hypothetical protein
MQVTSQLDERGLASTKDLFYPGKQRVWARRLCADMLW